MTVTDLITHLFSDCHRFSEILAVTVTGLHAHLDLPPPLLWAERAPKLFSRLSRNPHAADRTAGGKACHFWLDRRNKVE
jgi:hypothetical protein